MLEQSTLQDYLIELKDLEKQVQNGTQTQGDLLAFIELAQTQYGSSDEGAKEFFAGELAFHSGDYENALKYYLQCKEIPNYQFFCYRASAYLAQKKENNDQAVKFARKAYALNAEDQSTAAILAALVSSHTERESEDDYSYADRTELQSGLYTNGAVRPLGSPLGGGGFPPANGHVSKELYSLEQEFNSMKTIQEDARPASFKVDMLNSAEQALEMRIQGFQQQRAHYLSQYVKQSRQRQKLQDCCLFVFNGWDHQPVSSQAFNEKEEQAWGYFLLNNHMRKPSCGFYLRWKGVGIAINPGKRFLDSFHRAGLHISDIDIVIVTQADPEAYADVQQIYELNYHLNKISPELQIIRYYLNHQAHLELASILKPNFKQERNAIHSLELFIDSPEVEKVELTNDIILNYFPTSTQESLAHKNLDKGLPARHGSSALGIRLDMRDSEAKKSVKMGYLSGTPWSPLLSHHLGYCDILFAGFGHTHMNDFGKLNYNERCLGYFGTYSLLEEIKPRLLFCCEFDGREGDVRLEVCKKLRQELNAEASSQIILPADNGLFLDLSHLKVRCSVSHALITPTDVKVVKSGEAFSSLLYLAPSCLLE